MSPLQQQAYTKIHSEVKEREGAQDTNSWIAILCLKWCQCQGSCKQGKVMGLHIPCCHLKPCLRRTARTTCTHDGGTRCPRTRRTTAFACISSTQTTKLHQQWRLRGLADNLRKDIAAHAQIRCRRPAYGTVAHCLWTQNPDPLSSSSGLRGHVISGGASTVM